MREHSHQPIWRVDAIVAAPGADIDVPREDRTMEHEHVLTEHEHASVHRRGIGQPACARTFARHRVGQIHGRLHFHFMHRVSFLHVMMMHRFAGGWVNRPHLGRVFSFRFLNRHQFHPTFGTFARMVPHHFRMHYAGILRGFRFRSLCRKRETTRRN